MNVLFTCNSLLKGNGVRSAVLSLKSRLVDEGLDVRILACENEYSNDVQPDFPLKHFVFPFFEQIIHANGFRYAKIDKSVIRKAVAWADVIHVMEGFPLEAAVVRIADDLGKPCVGTYHTFSENITSNIGLAEGGVINRLINIWWKTSVYNHCKSVQCPTKTVKDYLTRHGYSSRLEVISNGVDLSGYPLSDLQAGKKPYRIITIGRLSNEKSHQTLIDAIRHSRHAAEIELYIAGKGPKAKKIRKAARKLFEDGIVKSDPVFGFYDSEQLKTLLKDSYLYIHCAKVEVEGLSCLESIRQGVVPVIADAPLSATGQFALDDRSLFHVSDSAELAEKIDWWIEHPDERNRMSGLYSESAKLFDIRESTKKIIRMYEEALSDEAT